VLLIEAVERERFSLVAVPLGGHLDLLRSLGLKQVGFLLDEGSPFVPIGALVPIDILFGFQPFQHLNSCDDVTYYNRLSFVIDLT